VNIVCHLFINCLGYLSSWHVGKTILQTYHHTSLFYIQMDIQHEVFTNKCYLYFVYGQDQLRERETSTDRDRHGIRGSPTSPRSSPTLSFGRISLSESLSSNAWPQVILYKTSNIMRNLHDIERGKPKNSEKNLSQCHFVQHNFHMD
jgi:hypothetical protein